MRTPTKVLTAVAVVGLAAASSAAFTGTGVTNTAGASQFVGGTVSQSVTGATLSDVAYTFADTTNTAISQVVLTFANADADTKAVSIAFSAATPVDFTCTAVEATGHTSTCTPTTPGTSQTGATSLAVTVV